MLNALRNLRKCLTRRKQRTRTQMKMRIRSYRRHPPFARTPTAEDETSTPEKSQEQATTAGRQIGPPGKQMPFRRRKARSKAQADTDSTRPNRPPTRSWIGAPGKKRRPAR